MLISSPRYRSRFSLHHLRPLLVMAILIGGSGLGISPLLADVSAPPGLIKNTATGSFVDELDPTNTVLIQSNEVSVTVIEVAGITISDPTITEPSATIIATTIGATAAPFQGIGGINQDDILYFDFEITNKGNDPTQFFIPGSPFAVTNGTFDRALYGAVQIIQIKNATGAIVSLINNVSKIDIPAAGANTGDLTILGIPAGSIPAGGSVTVRIPVKVTGGSGTLTVALGDTGANDNGVGTVNQPYTASTTTGVDVHTHDNPNNLTPNIPVTDEADGVLVPSAEKEASRFRIVPIIATPQVVGFKSAKLTDSNNDTKINPGETVTWTIDYVNTGSVDVTNFQITDLLPTGVTKSGAVILSVGGTGQATPTVNSSYTGTNTTLGTTDTLFTAPITLKVGGMIKVTIPVTINSGISGILSNQSSGIATNLPTVGIKTDNAGVTTDLPTNIQNSPYSVTVPTASISQTITTAIDSTKITVEAVVAPPATSFKSKINLCGILNFDTNSEGFRAATITYSSSSPSSYDGFTISPQSAPYPTSSPLFNWRSSGNPGGSIFTNDLDGNWTIFTTPDLGTDTNFSFLNSKSLTFDYKNDTGIVGKYDFWVALVGKNGDKVFYSFKTQLSGASTTAFSKVVVPMDATKWFTTFQAPGSAAPTSTAFADILANLDRIDIAAEGKDGPDLTELDSVGMACDRGDAPNTYSTLTAANGPSHQITSALKLGAKIDAENDGQPNATATGDNQDLSASNQIGVVNDEEGITAFPALTVGGTSYSIPAANITAVNTTGGAATLHAWIDFNKNGTFEASEYTSTTINTSGAATGPLSWTTGFTIGSSGTTVARFRLATDTSITASTPGSSATNGEVEDYQVPISAAVVSNPNVLLVKRITAINGNTTNGSIFLNTYDYETDTNNPSYPYDKNVIQLGITPPNSDKWPNTIGNPLSSTFLLGARNGGTIKPNDTVEYTIYFLSAGTSIANNVRFCDRVPANVTFIPNTFNNMTPPIPPDTSGLPEVDRGIAIQLGNTLRSYTNINDNDIARYYPPQSEPSTDFPTINCGGPNTNGAVVVNLRDRLNATGTLATDNTNGAYGFVRFRGQVK